MVRLHHPLGIPTDNGSKQVVAPGDACLGNSSVTGSKPKGTRGNRSLIHPCVFDSTPKCPFNFTRLIGMLVSLGSYAARLSADAQNLNPGIRLVDSLRISAFRSPYPETAALMDGKPALSTSVHHGLPATSLTIR